MPLKAFIIIESTLSIRVWKTYMKHSYHVRDVLPCKPLGSEMSYWIKLLIY